MNKAGISRFWFILSFCRMAGWVQKAAMILIDGSQFLQQSQIENWGYMNQHPGVLKLGVPLLIHAPFCPQG